MAELLQGAIPGVCGTVASPPRGINARIGAARPGFQPLRDFFSGRLLTKPDREQNKNYIEAGAPEQRSVDECERDVLPENDLQLQVSGA